MKFTSTVTLHSPVLQQWTRTSARSVGSAMMKTTIKMPGLGVIMRILVGVGFTIGGACFDRKPRARKKFICSYCLK